MNEKWFNVGMIIILTSIVANGLILMLTAFPGGTTYNGLYQSDLAYSNVKTDYQEQVNTKAIINNSQTNYDGSGITPIELVTGDPFGLGALTLVIKGVVGLELLLYTLGMIFPIFAIVFLTLATVVLAIKAVIVAYFASILLRLILGGRS